MSNKIEVIDARGNDHVVASGEKLQKLLRAKVVEYRQQYEGLMTRMNNELPSKEAAIPLMIALHLSDASVNERTLMFRALIERACWLDKEIRQLTTLGSTFAATSVYKITVADAERFGV